MILKDIPVLADRLKYTRETLGLSQIELARLAGTTQQAIQQAETGKAQNPRYLAKLAFALEIPPEWMSLNVMPSKKTRPEADGFSESGRQVLDSFYAMPKKDQDLMLELMKSRKDKRS